MHYWHPITDDLEEADDTDRILELLMDHYIPVTKERYESIEAEKEKEA